MVSEKTVFFSKLRKDNGPTTHTRTHDSSFAVV